MAAIQPTAHEIDVLRVYCKMGSVKQAAFHLGVAVQTVRNQLSSLYSTLDVHSAIEATIALGWTSLPSEPPRCGVWTRCPHPAGHSGKHA